MTTLPVLETVRLSSARMPSDPSRSCVTVPPSSGRAPSMKSSAQRRVGASAVPVVAKKKRFGSCVSQAPSSGRPNSVTPRSALMAWSWAPVMPLTSPRSSSRKADCSGEASVSNS
ncbi:hypothetical protein [Craurococcus roseus]|uniref:hypothetical protein n=1 Tax=Craurococcus roseus TaxID=77585 RepID=UPI0031D992E6